MSPSKCRTLARQYAAMTPTEAAIYDDWVRHLKAEQAEAAARKAEEERQYGVELQAMSDLDAVRETLRVTCDECGNDVDRTLQILTLAGFVRGVTLEAAYRAGFMEAGSAFNGELKLDWVNNERFIEVMRFDLANLAKA